jgi:hypothetical protein
VLRESFLFIGITERLDESIGSLASILGKPKLAIPRKNAAERDVGYDEARLRGEFSERNGFMVDVYRECLLIFEERRRKTFWERFFKKGAVTGSRG